MLHNGHDAARALSALRALDPGQPRAEWVRVGMAAKAAGVSLEDFTEWSRSAGNFGGERDCADAWRSFGDGGIKAATLYAMAFSAGWQDPARKHQKGRSATQPPRPAPSHARPEKTQQRPAIDALALWERCTPADALHPYIERKRGMPEGLRIVPADGPTIAGNVTAGWLAVPAWSPSGMLRTLQLIPPGTGKKLNLPGASFADGRFIVGNLHDSAAVYIVEGIGQAWACWQATGCAAVVCFGAGRMRDVAQSLRAEIPQARIVIVPDKGKEQDAETIAREVRGEWVAMPEDSPPNYDANDYAAEHGAEALGELLTRTSAPPVRYPLLTAGDLRNLPPLAWLVRGIVPGDGIGAIFGESGSGKTFLALDLCAAVAAGAEWFGYRVQSAPVVYVALEGEYGLRQRVRAWEIRNARPFPDRARFLLRAAFDLRQAEDVADLAEAIQACGLAGGLVVIDTLNRAAPGADENSSADMGQIIEATKRLRDTLGGIVLLVHHSGKDATKGMRGHSSLYAALDAVIAVSRNGGREWRIAKAKDGEDGKEHPFELRTVELGTDDEGEPVTSCIVAPTEAAPHIERPKVPKGGNQRIVYDALGDMLRNSADKGMAGAPAYAPCVNFEAAIEAIAPRLTCEPRRKTERTRQAMTGLITSKLIDHREGWIWLC